MLFMSVYVNNQCKASSRYTYKHTYISFIKKLIDHSYCALIYVSSGLKHRRNDNLTNCYINSKLLATSFFRNILFCFYIGTWA